MTKKARIYNGKKTFYPLINVSEKTGELHAKETKLDLFVMTYLKINSR